MPFAEMQTDLETVIGEISQKRKISLICGISWRGKRQPTSEFLPGEFHGQRTLAGYSPWGHQEPDTTEQLSTHTHILNASLKMSTGYQYPTSKVLGLPFENWW